MAHYLTSSVTQTITKLGGVWMAVWHLAFCLGSANTAFGDVICFDSFKLAPAMQEKVQAALVKVKESPTDISAVETLLAVEPRLVEAVGTSFSSSDPVRNQALQWSQSLQPPEVLIASLEKGSTAAVHWALRQIVRRRQENWFDKETIARLLPGIELALFKQPPATRAQAVETMMVCLPLEQRRNFLKAMLKDKPDEAIAEAVVQFANVLRQSDPEAEAIVAKWLNTADDPLRLRACCTYWWLVRSRTTSVVKDEEIAAFERIAGHPDVTVRSHVALAVEHAATPSRPRLIGVLLRLTNDKDPSVKHDAVRALRNANTTDVTARLRGLFATDKQGNIRAAAIEVLGIFGKDNLSLILRAAKEDESAGVRLNAVYALRHIGTPEAGKGLEASLQDPDKQVRDFAQKQFEWYRKEHPWGR
jgi:hypothetical protein